MDDSGAIDDVVAGWGELTWRAYAERATAVPTTRLKRGGVLGRFASETDDLHESAG